MAKKYYWLKFQKDFFKSLRIKKLRRLAGGDTFTIIYLKLQLLSLTTNGYLEYKGIFDSFEEEMAEEIEENVENIKITVAYLLSCGLMEQHDNQFFIPFVPKNTGSESESASRVREYREKKKALHCNEKTLHCNGETLHCNNNVDTCNTEKEKEKDIDIYIISSNDDIRCTQNEIQRVIYAWNSIGLKKITRIVEGTNRYVYLQKRIKDYGIDAVLQAIENAKNSKFLCDSTFFSFDWMIKPNNFPKVLDGNYLDKKDDVSDDVTADDGRQ